MSLKGFHIFFVTVSILLLVGFGAWALREYSRVDGGANLVLGVGSFLFVVVLLVYGRWFLHKLRSVD